MSFFQELKRRNVFRAGVAYALAAWVLLQAADFVLNLIAAPEWILQVFSLAALVGLPVVLIFSWVFEVTPEGIKLESHIDRSQSITHHTGRKLDRAIIGILVVAVAMLLVDKFTGEKAAPQNTVAETAQQAEAATADSTAEVVAEKNSVSAPSIAVLPFVNMSADPQNEYFSDGVAEEILNALARIPELKVSARTSAFTYKGSNEKVEQIAQELGVNHILEGSVRKEGNQVRVTAQLIEAKKGFHLWSQTYDRELTNIFAIQDEIAQAIATEMKVQLVPAAAESNLTGTTDLEAYEYYLQGVNQWHLRTGASLQNARELFEKAIARDPRFARAHAYLALTWAVISDYTDLPVDSSQRHAGEAARAALALDPESIEAATALMYSTNNVVEQRRYAKSAIALNPGFATTHQWYGTTLAIMGDTDGALREYHLALELDPRSRIITENLATFLVDLGEFDKAEALFRQLASFAPEYNRVPELMFQLHLLRGERALAEAAGNELALRLGRKRNTVPVYLNLFFEPDKKAAAVAEIASWPLNQWQSPDNPSLISPYEIVQMLAFAGAHDEALRMLKWLYANEGVYEYAFVRIVRFIPEFVCSADVQAFFASTNLPPLVEPYPCPQP